MIRNCKVVICSLEPVLQGAIQVASDPSTLYTGPANISAPTRGWQQAAALEGQISATVMIHASDDRLTRAAQVIVSDHPMAGEYRVTDTRVTRHEWAFVLTRVPVARGGEDAR